MQRIAIVDYGMGNIRSVQKAIEFVAPNDNCVLTNDPEIIRDSDRVVFPGQGAMGSCMTCLLYTSPSPRDQRGSRMPSSA